MSVNEIEALQIEFNILQSTLAGMRESIDLPYKNLLCQNLIYLHWCKQQSILVSQFHSQVFTHYVGVLIRPLEKVDTIF